MTLGRRASGRGWCMWWSATRGQPSRQPLKSDAAVPATPKGLGPAGLHAVIVAGAAGGGGRGPARGRLGAPHQLAQLPARPHRQPPQTRDVHLCGGGGAAPLVRRRPGGAPNLSVFRYHKRQTAAAGNAQQCSALWGLFHLYRRRFLCERDGDCERLPGTLLVALKLTPDAALHDAASGTAAEACAATVVALYKSLDCVVRRSATRRAWAATSAQVRRCVLCVRFHFVTHQLTFASQSPL